MYDQLQAIEDRYEELGELLSDPAVISDTKRFMQLSKEEANTRETVEVYRRYKEVVEGIKDTEEMLGENLDAEMAEMAKEELSDLKKEKDVLEERIKILLLPKDPNDDKNIIMEIRGAAGGDEAAFICWRFFSICIQKYDGKPRLESRSYGCQRHWDRRLQRSHHDDHWRQRLFKIEI